MGTKTCEADIIIAGGGLGGLAAAVFAARAGYSVAHIAPKTGDDPRTSALMLPSVMPLIEAGLIADPGAIGTSLSKIRIVDCTQRLLRAPETAFDSADAGVETFGWNFANTALNKAFGDAVVGLQNYSRLDDSLEAFEFDANGVHVRTLGGEAIKSRLLVGADGKASTVRRLAGIDVREHKHRQSALVCDLRLERSLDGASVEFHYENGPFTLVPAGGNIANLVWIDTDDVLATAKSGSVEQLVALFEAKSNHHFGKIDVISPATVFPLSTLSVAVAGRGPVALVGEAAHAFPPIGAQGLNLGLRDVAALSSALASHDKTDKDWAEAVVADYVARRAADLTQTTNFVEGLFQSLIADFLPAQMLRAGGLWALKLNSGFRKRAMKFGMGAH